MMSGRVSVPAPLLSLLLLSCCTCVKLSPAVEAAFVSTGHAARTKILHQEPLHRNGGDEVRPPSKTALNAERVPWDALRFVRQSSQFVTLPNPFRQQQGDRAVVNPGDTLWEPGSSRNTFKFAPLDDVVMGGASSSTIDNETGIWTGTVTSANNGGFVGIRSTPFPSSLDMTSCRGVEVRLKGGDAKRFKAVLRDSTDFNGVCWTTSFDAPKTRNNSKGGASIRLPFEKQIPTIFARTVPDPAPFRRDAVLGIQLAYSKFEYEGALNPNFSLGDFSLQIFGIYAY